MTGFMIIINFTMSLGRRKNFRTYSKVIVGSLEITSPTLK